MRLIPARLVLAMPSLSRLGIANCCICGLVLAGCGLIGDLAVLGVAAWCVLYMLSVELLAALVFLLTLGIWTVFWKARTALVTARRTKVEQPRVQH